MRQQNSNYDKINVERNADLLILQDAIAAYKLWHAWLNHLPKISRFTIGKRIDDLFVTLMAWLHQVAYAPKASKVEMIKRAIHDNDLLKFFLKLIWEMGIMDNNKFEILALKLEEIGRLSYRWMVNLEKTPPPEATAQKPTAGGQGRSANCR